MITRNECPVCSTPVAAPILSTAYSDESLQTYLSRIGFNLPREWFEGRNFSIHECIHCGLLFQREVLDDVQTARLYGQHTQETRLPEEMSILSLAHLAADALLMRQLISTKRPRVLDFGMGWGRFAMLAQAFGCEVHGVEMSAATREQARRHGIEVVEESDLKDSHYDFILADQVMEHLVHPAGLAERLATRLKPGGLMLLGVPGHRRLAAALRKAARGSSPIANLTDRDLDALCPSIHLNLFDSQSLRMLGESAGLIQFRPPFLRALGAGQLWDRPRQWNRNLVLAWKYWRGTGTRMWFQRPIQPSPLRRA